MDDIPPDISDDALHELVVGSTSLIAVLRARHTSSESHFSQERIENANSLGSIHARITRLLFSTNTIQRLLPRPRPGYMSPRKWLEDYRFVDVHELIAYAIDNSYVHRSVREVFVGLAIKLLRLPNASPLTEVLYPTQLDLIRGICRIFFVGDQPLMILSRLVNQQRYHIRSNKIITTERVAESLILGTLTNLRICDTVLELIVTSDQYRVTLHNVLRELVCGDMPPMTPETHPLYRQTLSHLIQKARTAHERALYLQSLLYSAISCANHQIEATMLITEGALLAEPMVDDAIINDTLNPLRAFYEAYRIDRETDVPRNPHGGFIIETALQVGQNFLHEEICCDNVLTFMKTVWLAFILSKTGQNIYLVGNLYLATPDYLAESLLPWALELTKPEGRYAHAVLHHKFEQLRSL